MTEILRNCGYRLLVARRGWSHFKWPNLVDYELIYGLFSRNIAEITVYKAFILKIVGPFTGTRNSRNTPKTIQLHGFPRQQFVINNFTLIIPATPSLMAYVCLATKRNRTRLFHS